MDLLPEGMGKRESKKRKSQEMRGKTYTKMQVNRNNLDEADFLSDNKI